MKEEHREEHEILDVSLDKKDRQILLVLQQNGRETLTNLAKHVGLSIDSVKNRIERLQKRGVIDKIKALIVPKNLGYPLTADIKIKLHNITQEQSDKFITYLQHHPRVIDLLSLMGDYDITCVLIAKDTADLDKTSQEIRQRFNTIIADWRGLLILKVHKFEEYSLE